MAWTSDQLKAIKTRGGKVLVSAAAGSGKTAVLSERVLDFVLSGGDINKLLVVTFTDAAAVEMKIRIKQKIEQQVLKEKENKHLIKQLTLIDNAKITTMDSFYSELVKQNFDKLGIMPDFNILSNAEENILKNKVVDNILDGYLSDNNFINLLHTLGVSDNNLIKDKIIKMESFLSTIPFYEEYISELLDKYSTSYYKDLFISDIKNKMLSYKNLYDEIKEELYNSSSDFDKLTNNIIEEENIINKLLDVNSFDELKDIIRLSSFSKQAVIRGHSDDYIFNKYKKIRACLKDEVTKKMEYLKYIDEAEYKRQMDTLKNVLSCFFDVVKKFKNTLLEEKKKINKYSFNDIPLFVVDLLIKDNKKTLLAKEISEKFDEILIDEYQDTNKLQSVIFSLVSKDESNLFVVGDIKQSIYRFRSACPEIFNEDKNNSYKDKFPMLITLSKNFRSRNLVLDFCNFIFETTMSNYFGEVEYNDLEKLYTGASFPINDEAVSEIDILNFESEKDEEDELSNAKKEAIYVADKIKNLLDNKYQVFDKKGFYRDIKPSDIAILSRSLSNSELYRTELEKRKIGIYCNKDLVFFDNSDVKLIIALLKVIDNYYDDISLMTVLKSNLFNITDSDIARVRIDNKYGYLYDSLTKSNDIKIINFINILDDIRSYSYNNSLEDILIYTYKKLDIINIIGTNKNKIKNLNLMIQNAKEFNSSLHEFVSYIDEILLDKSSFSGANPLSDGDNVLMTTIHRSKGLEYPVVFVVNTGKKFNEEDFKLDYLIDSNYGISFDLFDYEKKYKYEIISAKVLKKKMKLLMLSEELRVLYVALTRAREKLIITGCVNNLTKLLEDASYLIGNNKRIDNLYLENCNNYIKWILGSLLKHKKAKELRDYANVDVKTYDFESIFKINIIDGNIIKEEGIKEESNIVNTTNNITINKYDYSLSNVPLYLSVSDIKHIENNYVKKPYFLNNDKKATNIGTLYHKLFEVLPIKKYTVFSLKEELNNLVEKNIISKKDLNMIDLEKIFCYLTSDIYDMILQSDFILREKEIVFNIPSNLYDEKLNSGEILINGIVDMIFKYDGMYYILDYKTDKIGDIKELESRYKIQLDLYEMGVKNIYNTNKVKKIIYSVILNKYIYV